MLAAALLAGNDLNKMSPETLAVLENRNVIAIDQDPLGMVSIARLYQGMEWYFYAIRIIETQP